jgi:hemerythrin-like domain-containing protein
MSNQRRGFLRASALVGAGLLVTNCRGSAKLKDEPPPIDQAPPKKIESDQGEVTATEDLMREHGVLRRALLVYTSAATMLRAKASVPPEALRKTATLFRAFGEDYHEKRLEEAFIFPAVKQAGGPAAAYPDILIAQHQRGREITDYIMAAAQGATISAANIEPLARAIESLVLMYRHHAAREDTIIFPAWKQTLSPEQLDEMNDKFEDIEHEQFGEDGFEDAVRQIGNIEASLGIADIGQFTAPPPPKL